MNGPATDDVRALGARAHQLGYELHRSPYKTWWLLAKDGWLLRVEALPEQATLSHVHQTLLRIEGKAKPRRAA